MQATSKPGGQAGGQRLAQVVLDQLDLDPGAGDLRPDPGQHLGVGVDHGQPARRSPRARRRWPRSPPRSGRRRRASGSAARPAPRPRASAAPGGSSWRPCSASGPAPAWPRAPRPRPGRAGRPGWPARRGPRARCRRSAGSATSRSAAGAASRSRPAGVSRTGRVRSTTPRLRSSLQTAATIGTGSSAMRLTSRTATGSLRAIARSTSPTPASPSASPTAAATSAMTESMLILRNAPGFAPNAAGPGSSS